MPGGNPVTGVQPLCRSSLPDVAIPRLPFSEFVWEHSVREHGDKVQSFGTAKL